MRCSGARRAADVSIDDRVKASVIARGTPGFSGADLANLVNEAALFAARGGKRLVSMDEFEKAKDKIMMGAERKSMVMSDKEKLTIDFQIYLWLEFTCKFFSVFISN